MEDQEDRSDIFNTLVTECIDQHAPLKQIKCTRPPATWLKSLHIQQLKSECNHKRYLAHLTQKTSDWTAYREVRNKLKHAIWTIKKKFLTSALSDERSKCIWCFIHWILKTKNRTLTVNVEDLNKHFITSANCLLISEYLEPQDIFKTLEFLPDQTSKANLKSWKRTQRSLFRLLCAFLERPCTLKDTMNGFRKLHSTNTLLLKICDNTLNAMSKEELTLSVYSDYSKAFDTVQKLHKIGFSTAALKWFIRYLWNRSQYVQINDSKSATNLCHFGVLQRSVLGPLLFNLYVNNLQDIDPADSVNTCHTIKTLQNLTNSTIYPKDSKASEQSKRFVMKQ